MRDKALRDDDAVRWMHWGILLIILLSGPLHFAFEALGRPAAFAALLPVNESVFEHLKLTFWPLLLWWGIGYPLRVRSDPGKARRWLLAALCALVVSPLFMTVFYYTYTGAFGIHSLFLDVLSLPLSLLAAHFLALHLYRHVRVPKQAVPVLVGAAFLLIAAFVLFTYQPPRIPLFLDTSTGQYGIN